MFNVVRAACVALALVIAHSTAAKAQVPEIPNPALQDLAMAMMTPAGPAIFYNPILCARDPLFCRFTRAHEYGHIALGHILGGTHPAMAEMQADCFAAQNAQPDEIEDAIRVFEMRGNAGDPVHGTGLQRAQRIRDATTGNCHW